MKFTIHGFSQEVAIKLKLDNDELLLLRWFVDFQGSNQMNIEIRDNVPFFWVYYKKVIKDIPVISLKEDTIYRKFKKIVKAGVLKIYTKRLKGTDGHFKTYSYYAYDKNYNKLIGFNSKVECSDENPSGHSENYPTGHSDKNPYKDSSIINTDSSINKTTTVVVDIFTITSFYDRIKNKIGVAVSKKAIEEMIQKRGETEINKYIDNWDKFSGTKKKTVAGFFKNAVMDSYVIPEGDITSDGKPKEEWERPIESDEYYNSFCENGGNER